MLIVLSPKKSSRAAAYPAFPRRITFMLLQTIADATMGVDQDC